VFTINNPTIFDDIEIEKAIEEATYLCYGIEIGEQGTRHYQGFVMFSNPRSYARIKSMLTRAHLEGRKGTVQQAIEYCEKDGQFREWGTRPAFKKTSKERFKWCIQQAREGNIGAIEDEEPGIFLRYLQTFRSLNRRRHETMGGPTNHEWWYGSTGTGKSKRLNETYPEHYRKQLNKWWDGYEDQDTVGIEEISPECGKWMGHLLKIWADRYPFNAEVKGGCLQNIRPKKLIVTSNYSIEECFPNEQDYKPLKRRFKVTHFNNMFNVEEQEEKEEEHFNL